MIKITRKNWAGWLSAALITATLLGGVFSALICKGIASSETAGWMQAIGSVAAIVGAGYGIKAQLEHTEKKAINDRRSEEWDRENADIFSRTLAAKNMVQVATQAVSVLAKVVEVARDPTKIYDIGDHRERLGQLREIIDGLISASTDHVAVLSALNLAMFMTQTLSDLSNVGGTESDKLISRCESRALEATDFVNRLIELQVRLVGLCTSRGISLDSRDFE